MAALLRAVYNHAVDKRYSYFMVGLCEDHPLLELVTSTYAHIDYRSQLYLVAWEQELDVLANVDDRLPAVEISIL